MSGTVGWDDGVMKTDVAATLAQVHARIERAALAAGREAREIRLVAVSKTFPVPALREALAAGALELGESRAQELAAKARELEDDGAYAGERPGAGASVLAPRWVFIGPVQTNKARDIARWAHEVQSVDRREVVDALERRLVAADRTLDVLIQVNTSGEAAKSGTRPQEGEVLALARAVEASERMRLRGLMTIATRGGDEAETRRCFRRLAQLRSVLQEDGLEATDLSMGMSGDLELAIAEGATTVRVGRAIFGARAAA